MDPASLFISMIFGSIGVGFFIYGKKQARPVHMIVGIALGAFPYFVSNLIWMVLIGVVLVALPFLF